MRVVLLGVAAAALALGLLAYDVQLDNLGTFTSPERAAAIVAVAWAFVVAGLVAWSRRPGNRLGPLMTAAGLALLLRQLRYSHDPAVFTAFFALGEVGYALAAHSVLAYPWGRVRGRAERALVPVGYAAMLAFPLAVLLFYEGTRPLRYMDETTRESLLVVFPADGVALAVQTAFVVAVWGVLATAYVALIVRRLARATPRARRVLAPLLLAALAFALRAVFEGVFAFLDRPAGLLPEYLFWWQVAGFAALPVALLVGMLRARLARASVGDLVLELEHTSPHGFRGALRRALGDPTLEVAFWLPERRTFVDAAGAPVDVPEPDGRRAVTRLEHEGEPLGVLVHDATLVEEPRLIGAAAAAARLALENARLHAEMRAQLARVRESRIRIVEAADEERRRIERDIHDGAQQRLLALALQLRTAQRRLGAAADPALDGLLEAAVEELQVAVEELRELARGVHPAILTEEGLAAALESLRGRTPLPVSLQAVDDRFPPAVEATAYFVVCEALANVVKHSRATRAAIRTGRRDGVLLVEVRDDGVGGAEADRGSGLRGLTDRVEALGGRLLIESPAGGGTRIVGEIPCAP